MKKKDVALITGASRGIGRAIAITLAKRGYPVIIGYHHNKALAQELETCLQSQGYNALAIGADVSQLTEVKTFFHQVEERMGPIEILVNNAGIAQQKLFTDITPKEWDTLFAVNVRGVFLCCQAVLPGMICRKRGRIINISSIWGVTGASCEVHYSASKAAIIGFTKALAKEVGPSGITVNCVAPGVITTDMNASLSQEVLESLRAETPLGILGTPQNIADAVAFLASSQANFITGQVLSPNGGLVI